MAKALSPAKVVAVIISDDGTQADVIVPDNQLSLAIGKEGQNARLAARLTGVRIDIRGETEPLDGLDDDADYEEGEWVANAETGAMEWHAADGTVLTQEQWNEQAAAVVADEQAADEAQATAAQNVAADEAVTEGNNPAEPEGDAGATPEAGGDHA